MAPKHAYTAFLIQYVQDAGSQERLSVGVALECPTLGFVGCSVLKSVARISQAFPGTDTPALRRTLASIQAAVESTPVGRLRERLAAEVPAAFDSGLVLGHEVTGITADPSASLAALFERFAPKEDSGRTGRNDEDVWQDFARRLHGHVVPMIEVEAHGLLPHTFRHVWKNGVRNAIEALSLDHADDARKRAAKNAGIYRTLANANRDLKISLVVGTPRGADADHAAARAGIEILQQDLGHLVEIVPEDEAGELAARIVKEAHEFN